MGFIEWLKQWLETDNTKIIYVLALILCMNIIDFLFGWVNAKFNNDVQFSSSKAIFGIARKMLLFILCFSFIPMALLVPEPIGIGALYVLFMGYLISEINSILSHLKVTDDDKADVFVDFINRIFNLKGGNDK